MIKVGKMITADSTVPYQFGVYQKNNNTDKTTYRNISLCVVISYGKHRLANFRNCFIIETPQYVNIFFNFTRFGIDSRKFKLRLII